jgi:hypothetical protein
MEKRYNATTQNRFYPDMSNVLVNKIYYSGGKTYQPTYVLIYSFLILIFCSK